MADYFIPRADAQKVIWLNNFSSKIGNYMTKYGITAAEKTDMVNFALDFAFRVSLTAQMKTALEGVVKWKNGLRDGISAGGVVSVPVMPSLASAPTAVAPGGFDRVADLVKKIKNNNAYTEADGADLGIIGNTANRSDLSTLKPVIVLKAGTAGRSAFGWKLNDMDGLNVYKDEGTGTFRFYARDNHPDYEDTAPLPANPVRHRYKFIYVLNDEEVGQFSDVITVNVGQ